MPYDANAVLQAAVTKTTAFNGAGFDLGTGTPRRGLKIRFTATNVSGAGAGGVFSPHIEHSDDNTTFTDLVYFDALTVGTAAATSQQWATAETDKRYIRLATDMSVTTSTPTMTYYADIGIARNT